MLEQRQDRALLDVDPETMSLVAEYVPRFRFVLDDLSSADDHALRGRSLTAVAAAGLMLLARGRSGPSLVDDLRRWLDVLGEVAAAPNGVAALSAFLEYAFRVGEVLPAAHPVRATAAPSWTSLPRAAPHAASPLVFSCIARRAAAAHRLRPTGRLRNCASPPCRAPPPSGALAQSPIVYVALAKRSRPRSHWIPWTP
jgi:hypothetical protein